MARALRVVSVLLGIGLWVAGCVVLTEGSHALGAILILLGALAVVVALVSDRGEGIWETLSTWLSQLPKRRVEPWQSVGTAPSAGMLLLVHSDSATGARRAIARASLRQRATIARVRM
jgi:hypothetical protein